LEKSACFKIKFLFFNTKESISLSQFEDLFNQVQRGLLLLKNHLDLFQKRNSYQLRLLKISNAMHYSASSDNLQSHLKQLEQVNEELRLYSFSNEIDAASSAAAKSNTSKNVLNIVCSVHSTQFKFNLIISANDCVGDLKAIVREILIRIFKSNSTNCSAESESSSSQDEKNTFTSPNPSSIIIKYFFLGIHLCVNNSESKKYLVNLLVFFSRDSKYLTFNSVFLTNPLLVKYNQHLFTKAYKQIIALNLTSKDLASILKSVNENEDNFYVKITANGQDFTTLMNNNTSIDSKFIHEFGLKDMQTIVLTLHTTQAASNGGPTLLIKKECIPMLILAQEPHFSNLFQLVSLTCLFKSHLNSASELGLRKKCLNLSCKLWKIIVLIPTDKAYINSIKTSPELHLTRLVARLSAPVQVKQTELANTTAENGGSDLFHVFSPISLDSTPYQLLYYLQIFEIVFIQSQIQKLDQDHPNEESIIKGLYRLLSILVAHLMQRKRTNFEKLMAPDGNKRNSSLTLEVLLECVLIVLRLLCNYLFENKSTTSGGGLSRTTNKLKHGLASESIAKVDDDDDDEITATELATEEEAAVTSETPPKRQKKVHTSAATNFYNNPQVSPYQTSFLAKLVNVPTLRVPVFKSMVAGDCDTFVNLVLNVQILASLTNNSVSFYNNSSSHLTSTSIELLFNSMQLVTSYLFGMSSAVASCSLFVPTSGQGDQADPSVKELRQNWLKCLLMIEHFKLSAQSESSSVDLSVAFRREACAWLYRTCVLADSGSSCRDNSNEELVEEKSAIKSTILSEMLDLLGLAVKSKPVS
jgi:hypothetical protein